MKTKFDWYGAWAAKTLWEECKMPEALMPKRLKADDRAISDDTLASYAPIVSKKIKKYVHELACAQPAVEFLFCYASFESKPSLEIDVDHLEPYQRFSKRQKAWLKHLNQNPELAQSFLGECVPKRAQVLQEYQTQYAQAIQKMKLFFKRNPATQRIEITRL